MYTEVEWAILVVDRESRDLNLRKHPQFSTKCIDWHLLRRQTAELETTRIERRWVCWSVCRIAVYGHLKFDTFQGYASFFDIAGQQQYRHGAEYN